MTSSRRPRRIGKYKILSRLGSGGMSEVYRAIADDSETEVALKVTPIKNDVDVTVADFQLEVMVGRRVEHRHVVKAIDHGCRDGFIFLAMPIIHGATLSNSTRLRDPSRRPSSPTSSAYRDSWIVPMLENNWHQIARIGEQMADALAACHEGGVIHRDVKPGNIIMDRNGDAFLMDFGLAWLRRGPQGQELGDRAGTARYLPPEVFDERRDERSDVYSLGLTLHELATGKKTWGEIDHETMKEIRPQLEVDSLSGLLPEMPAGLAECIDRACQNNPDERQQSARELEEEFSSVLKTLDDSAFALCAADSSWGTIEQTVSFNSHSLLTADVWFANC